MTKAGWLEIRLALGARLEAIEEALRQFQPALAELREQKERFAAELLLREALTNAVVHGCQSDPSKAARCRLRIRNRRLTISIADDGPGFDWKTVSMREAENSDCSGRGLEIFRKFATRFRFNGKGNAVTIWKKF